MSDMPFQIVMSAGGDLDRVGEIGKLPYPLFPRKEVKKVKGSFIDIPPNQGTYSKLITLDKDVEFVSVSLAGTGYLFPDYWELTIGIYKIYETIYTKEVPQTITSGNAFIVLFRLTLLSGSIL
jgi:hypothetical protein